MENAILGNKCVYIYFLKFTVFTINTEKDKICHNPQDHHHDINYNTIGRLKSL